MGYAAGSQIEEITWVQTQVQSGDIPRRRPVPVRNAPYTPVSSNPDAYEQIPTTTPEPIKSARTVRFLSPPASPTPESAHGSLSVNYDARPPSPIVFHNPDPCIPESNEHRLDQQAQSQEYYMRYEPGEGASVEIASWPQPLKQYADVHATYEADTTRMQARISSQPLPYSYPTPVQEHRDYFEQMLPITNGPRPAPWGGMEELERQRRNRGDARKSCLALRERIETENKAFILGRPDDTGKKRNSFVEELRDEARAVYPDMQFEGPDPSVMDQKSAPSKATNTEASTLKVASEDSEQKARAWERVGARRATAPEVKYPREYIPDVLDDYKNDPKEDSACTVM
ncbi:hypothetical protein BDV95DRAFT_602876 [Massariosphaeria phaeospora]|uniref:Uncharacterized protein n=1 Tax=Massariosphaeria phaeospora TaxID=100035 RepID=A0A7C8MRP9_9PLEO|nr:hypothetical protein BDV95DRAFT_602876 [Massariosphaeria phaeospora]